jgi:dTDP-4-amino-4,6-dideoxygalactose transaminase
LSDGRRRTPAILGGGRAFDRDVPVGQMYFPTWQRYEEALRGVFERQWYTNHGPLAREAEERMADRLGVRHAICVTNGTIGLMMAAKALELAGRVITSSFSFVATAQAMTWAGLEPVFADVSLATHHMTADTATAVLDDTVCAVHPVNIWGGTCDPAEFEAFGSQHGLPVYFDSAQAFGCTVGGRKVATFGSLEVFSLHATKILGTAEGGCVTTDDDDLAERLRNIRASYGTHAQVTVPVTLNGRFSEAQAALCLLALDEFDERIDHNRTTRSIYRSVLDTVPGARLLEPPNVAMSNEQYAVVEIDEESYGLGRDELLRALKAEGVNARRYFYPGVHRTLPYSETLPLPDLPNTDLLSRTVLQLPIGALVDEGDARIIAELVGEFHESAELLRGADGR